jgi:hypothetical protein
MGNPLSQPFQAALKEWAVAVDALIAAETVVLLRKGGIREAGFKVDSRPFWLYPTYEHQKPELLKPQYGNLVTTVAPGWHPGRVSIGAWAIVTHQYELKEQAQLDRLMPHHIWNEDFTEMRLKWKPNLALTVVFLRVFRLNKSVEIPFEPAYGGCRSWTTLQPEIDASDSVAVLSDDRYAQTVREILALRDARD